jgi:hypothetical protein
MHVAYISRVVDMPARCMAAGCVSPAVVRAEREPAVPGWLVERLLFTVGVPESEIRAMTADEARAAWDAYQARPR